MFTKKSNDPVLVEVKDGRWECYGNPTTARHYYLLAVLTEMGGVSDSVPEGLYDFYTFRRFGRLCTKLEPHKQ